MCRWIWIFRRTQPHKPVPCTYIISIKQKGAVRSFALLRESLRRMAIALETYLNFEALDRAAQALSVRSLAQEPMALHTTFKIGGPADRLLFPETEEQLAGLLQAVKESGLPWLALGNGSNLLVSDLGIRGAVLCLSGSFKKVELLPDGRTLRAGAGASLATACAFARDRGLSGLEFAWGIPGSVGGAAYMNAGAYGGEMKDVLKKAFHISDSGEPGSAAGEALGLSYRKSRYTGGTDIVTSVELALAPGDATQVAARMEELMARRKEKQPYDQPSAGSVFKRPENGFAAALIDQCGLKGRRVGGARVSEKHAGFIVNAGGATCRDVLELIEIIRETVKQRTGTLLECEVRVLGEGMG